ncbi:MAG TPA: 16S rRNA (adenine(1518)-N(6)/adenine(1519)-N(6))-dimethyltransferase RsmA [Candidatus Saccharimonadales bacterium]|nr:16S rRNA (adenine(1518)-N(6)/adenine(1519)-N(6))-dimethyltransferase RsmA [Candidatus Saccharimonadales bacterium]
MDLTDVDDLKVAMRLAGLKAQKTLGQHFLVDNDSLEAVMQAGELNSDDVVLEIGPGLGVMTAPLAAQVKSLVAVEMDQDLATLLERDKPVNLDVRQADIISFDLTSLPSSYKVVANIPYYLTSKIFRLLLESSNPPAIMSLLIQKEVAQRIVARPGQMSVLAFSVQYYGAPTLVRIVERHKFWPPPKVDSAILQVKVYDQPAFNADRDKLFRLVKAGFGEKRKMLKNSLAGGLNLEMALAERLLKEAKIKPTARAQELDMRAWQRLYDIALKYEII